eukprot:TRINITY_DN941_c0_g1_i5.p1 TRINITY_DN941_c0_g1~~TRINITY_DN941_c0_g1_i5.p1  ORF type:complete len:210 (-),score=38.04 TRINITY_DN941_c0_g1_i5:208-837(-)
MFGRQAATERMRLVLREARDDDDVELSMEEFLSTFGGVLMSQLQIKVWIRPFNDSEEVHAVDARVFGTLSDVWALLNTMEWMPYISDTMAFKIDGAVYEDRRVTLKDGGIREGCVLWVFDTFDPFPQMGAVSSRSYDNSSAWGSDSPKMPAYNDDDLDEVDLLDNRNTLMAPAEDSGAGIEPGINTARTRTRWVREPPKSDPGVEMVSL